MYGFQEGSVYSQQMYTTQKCSKRMPHVSRLHPTSPEGVSVEYLDLHTLLSVDLGGLHT